MRARLVRLWLLVLLLTSFSLFSHFFEVVGAQGTEEAMVWPEHLKEQQLTYSHSSTYSSSTPIEWNKTYGGADTDWAQSVEQTSDGGYIFAGSTFSIAPSNGSFAYYIAGMEYTVSSSDDIVIADTSGVHLIY